MKVLDPGHLYTVDIYDGSMAQAITFMKREGGRYPGNVGHHPGTNCQELIRMLIDRVKYLEEQIPCPENGAILHCLRTALVAFELRAARIHKRPFKYHTYIEDEPHCTICGHIRCLEHL